MEYANKEALLEALSLNKNANARKEITQQFDTKLDYEGVLE